MKKKKKVLFCTTGRIGGAARIVITISTFLDPKKYDIENVIIDKKVEEIVDYIPQNRITHFIHIRNSWDFLTLKLFMLIKQSKADIIMGSLSHYNPRIIMAAKLAGIEAIVRSNNMWCRFKQLSLRFMMRLTYPMAKWVIVQQDEMGIELLKEIPSCKKNLIVLQNPLDTEKIEANLKADSPYNSENETRFVWMGRITELKGYDILLSAFLRVKKRIPNAHLYLLGRIIETDSFYNSLKVFIANNKLETCVHFTGVQANPHVWIKHCNCFVLPSRVEGLPNALIEAMYCNVPVVASECLPIIKRMIRDGYNGYTVPVGDSIAMADAMEKALVLKNFTFLYKPAEKQEFCNLFE